MKLGQHFPLLRLALTQKYAPVTRRTDSVQCKHKPNCDSAGWIINREGGTAFGTCNVGG